MRKKMIALVLTILAVTILVCGLFAFYNYPRASPRASYQLLLDNVVGYAYANGVSVSVLTQDHGQLAQIQIFVTYQHAGNSTMVLSYTVNFTGNEVTSSRYTVGQTIIIHRTYKDGYAETTNSSILLTQQMLRAGGPPPLGGGGPAPQVFEIPVQQWVPLVHTQGVQGPRGAQSQQGIHPYDLAWLNVAIPLVASIVSVMVLIRGFSKEPKETDK
jgi:hypothetical protein